MTRFVAGEEGAQEWIRSTLNPSQHQWDALQRFAACLVRENERQNLVSASTLSSLWVRHLADSAQLLNHSQNESGGWIDLGSGPGLPGLVIAILRDAPILLVESRKLRCNFLREVVAELQLQNVTVAETRLELLDSFPAAVITARAFAPLEKLLDLANRFATDQTVWLLPKGRNAVKELESLPKSWQNMFHVEQSLTDAESRILVGRGQVPAKKREKA